MPPPEPAESLPLVVNGEPHPVPAGTDLAGLVARLGHAPEAVATAVNGDFVPRALRPQHRLQPGDQVSCFKPIVGG